MEKPPTYTDTHSYSNLLSSVFVASLPVESGLSTMSTHGFSRRISCRLGARHKGRITFLVRDEARAKSASKKKGPKIGQRGWRKKSTIGIGLVRTSAARFDVAVDAWHTIGGRCRIILRVTCQLVST